MVGFKQWHVFAALAAFYAAVSLWFAYNHWGDIIFALKGGSFPNTLAAYAQPFFFAVIFWRFAHRFHKDFPARGAGVWEAALLAVSAVIAAAPYSMDTLRGMLFQPLWGLATVVMSVFLIYAAARAIKTIIELRRGKR